MARIVRRKNDTAKKYSVKHKGRLAAFILLLVIVIVLLLINSSFFDIKTVTLYGAQSVSEFEILQAIDLGEDKNILRLDEEAVKNQIEQSNPVLEVLNIVRVLPNTVEIYLKERKVSIQVPCEQGYVHIDTEGHALSMQQSSQAVLMDVAGATVSGTVVLGKKVSFSQEQTEKDFYALVEQMALYGLVDQTQKLDMSVSDDVKIVLRSGFILRIGLPTQIRQKLSYFQPALEEVQKLGHTSGILDLSAADGTVGFAPIE